MTRITMAALLTLFWCALAHATPGALTQLAGTDGCVSDDGSGGACADGRALGGALGLTMSPDDKNVYVAAFSDGIAVLARDKKGKVGPVGALSQLAGTEGCVNETGLDGCGVGVRVTSSFDVVVSQDGKSVYVAADTDDAVSVFARNKSKKAGTVGALAQLAGTDACVSEDGSGGDCADGVGLDRVAGIVVPRDGKHVYAATNEDDALAAFTRNKKKKAGAVGALTQLAGTDACVSEDGTGGACVDGVGLEQAVNAVASPDGKFVYATAFASDALTAFARDKKTGVLTQLAGADGCVSDDGLGGCTEGAGLGGARGVAISKDGKFLYVAAELGSAVAVFARDKKTGVLTQLAGTDGCVSASGTGGLCAVGTALGGARGVAVSRDGRSVYVAATASDAVAVFARDKSTGVLTQLAGTEGCISADGTGGACAVGLGLDGASDVVVSKDGKNVYVASLISDAVAAFARAKK